MKVRCEQCKVILRDREIILCQDLIDSYGEHIQKCSDCMDVMYVVRTAG